MVLSSRKPGDAPPSAVNTAGGMVQHIVYLGSESVYEIRLENGRRVKVLLHNRGGDSGRFDYDELVWVSWPASAPVILTE